MIHREKSTSKLYKINQEIRTINEKGHEHENAELDQEEDQENDEENGKKKDKKLVFLSRSVLEKIKERPMTTGTEVRNIDEFNYI